MDFTGTDQQVEGPLNSVLGYTASGVYMTIQAATDPTIPPNGGCYRPVGIVAPKGTIVNPNFPAACTGGNEIVSVIHNAVYRALAEIPRDIPNPVRLMAADQGSSNNLFLSGFSEEGERFVLYEYPEGGWGGADGRDGQSAIYSIVGNTWNLPVEAIEMRYPLRIDRYELRQDSGGPGKWRGGAVGATRLPVACPHRGVVGAGQPGTGPPLRSVRRPPWRPCPLPDRCGNAG